MSTCASSVLKVYAHLRVTKYCGMEKKIYVLYHSSRLLFLLFSVKMDRLLKSQCTVIFAI